MKINKNSKFDLRKKIGISIGIIFLLLLFCSIKWANYQKMFQFKVTEISGYKILNHQDYFEKINQLNKNNNHVR